MSRIGKLPIAVPQGVEVKITNHTVMVKGPKGQLSHTLHPLVSVEFDSKARSLHFKVSSKEGSAFQGLYRSLVSNAIEGVTKGFSKEMAIVGLGYSAKVQGKDLVLSVGYTKPIQVRMPEGIAVEVQQATNPAKFTIKGADKHLVGQFAAMVRGLRPVEPYKGKGVRYKDEVVRKKAGKAFATAQQA